MKALKALGATRVSRQKIQYLTNSERIATVTKNNYIVAIEDQYLMPLSKSASKQQLTI